jgi:hypothetical protein
MNSYNIWYQRNKERVRASKAANMRRYREQQPEKHRAQSRAAKTRLRASLVATYGAECALCGFSDQRALTLDHILNNGAAERAELGERGVYRRALLPDFRHEYRILCMNCQFIARAEAGRQNQHPAEQF